MLNAIRTGYRLIDTAAVYDGHEDAVGEAGLREAIAGFAHPRGVLFITSKLWVRGHVQHRDGESRIAASLKINRNTLILFATSGDGDYFRPAALEEACREAGTSGKRRRLHFTLLLALTSAKLSELNQW